MAKIHLDRIKNRYGWTGKRYQELMQKIITENTESVSEAVAKTTHSIFAKERERLGVKKKLLSLPDLTDVIPGKSVFIRKGAERGKLITDALRDKLAKDLRSVLDHPDYIVARGRYTGRLRKRVTEDFEKKIQQTFEGYTRKHPAFGVPTNVHAIAVTELRSAVDQIKAEYVERFRAKNPDASGTKTWIHNASLSKSRENIRKHHQALNKVEIPLNKNFVAHNHESGKTYSIPYPHHASLPAEEVINCHCTVVYRMKLKDVITPARGKVKGKPVIPETDIIAWIPEVGIKY